MLHGLKSWFLTDYLLTFPHFNFLAFVKIVFHSFHCIFIPEPIPKSKQSISKNEQLNIYEPGCNKNLCEICRASTPPRPSASVSASLPSSSSISSLPPMPPLLAFDPSRMSAPPASLLPTNGIQSSSSSSTSDSALCGLNLSTRLTTISTSGSSSSTCSLTSTMPETESWLSALSGQVHGQKRAETFTSSMSQLPQKKRPRLEPVVTGSPTSSNSNMSPLVGKYTPPSPCSCTWRDWGNDS